ncbi:hypothetical protein DMENIID0001_092420 [Sergentomyia squamirostris]
MPGDFSPFYHHPFAIEKESMWTKLASRKWQRTSDDAKSHPTCAPAEPEDMKIHPVHGLHLLIGTISLTSEQFIGEEREREWGVDGHGNMC